jgi:hypothetical protein
MCVCIHVFMSHSRTRIHIHIDLYVSIHTNTNLQNSPLVFCILEGSANMPAASAGPGRQFISEPPMQLWGAAVKRSRMICKRERACVCVRTRECPRGACLSGGALTHVVGHLGADTELTEGNCTKTHHVLVILQRQNEKARNREKEMERERENEKETERENERERATEQEREKHVCTRVCGAGTVLWPGVAFRCIASTNKDEPYTRRACATATQFSHGTFNIRDCPHCSLTLATPARTHNRATTEGEEHFCECGGEKLGTNLKIVKS